MIGGNGNDVYFVDNAGDVIIEKAGGGTDYVYTSISYVLGNNVENATLATGTDDPQPDRQCRRQHAQGQCRRQSAGRRRRQQLPRRRRR
ncbi:MAG: hypothetical protein WDN06_18375 [Asticcacaulis sp.]